MKYKMREDGTAGVPSSLFFVPNFIKTEWNGRYSSALQSFNGINKAIYIPIRVRDICH